MVLQHSVMGTLAILATLLATLAIKSLLWHISYRIAGNFRKVFIFGYFEEALLFENKFPCPVVLRK